MFQRLPDAQGATVGVTIDGRPFQAREGDTVTATLLAAGMAAHRATAVSGTPRGPYCMMGVCFDCLVVVDGIGNRQGCLTRVAPGMRIESQQGKRDIRQ